MYEELESRDAGTLFAKARIASEVAKMALGAAGRGLAYSVKDRYLAAMVRLTRLRSILRTDRSANRYRLVSPFGEIHYLKRV